MKLLSVLLGMLCASSVHACIWDADTLEDEKKARPKVADVIFAKSSGTGDVQRHQERIKQLRYNPKEGDPKWWNDLAGAHLRLGRPDEAAKLLEPVVKRFPNDYGVHANLGTAYHLLGHYVEAEKHIARDLEINPNAHFGLEKYHLALLQYLIRDREYQRHHLYVYEFSEVFREDVSPLFHYYATDSRPHPSAKGRIPSYLKKFKLAEDPKLMEGVLYMASLNPKEPACFVMLGISCVDDPPRDYNLAIAAFEKAIKLGSPQKELLQERIAKTREYIKESQSHNQGRERLRGR